MKNTSPQTAKAAATQSLDNKSYKGIQLSGVLFVILMAGMLIANIMVSDSLKDDSSGINLAGRQRMLSQRMTKSMAAVQASIAAGDFASASKFQKELKLSSGLFDETLKAFRDGGVTTGATGDDVRLVQVLDPELAGYVAKADTIWQDLSSGVEYMAHQDITSIDKAKSEAIMIALVANNLELLKLMNQLTVGLEAKAESKSSTLQWVLAGALALVVANFAYVIIYSVGLLKKRDGKLEEFSSNLIDKNSQLSDTNLALESAQSEISEANNSLESALDSLRVSNSEAQKRAGELEQLTVDLNRLKEESDTIFNSVDHGLCLIDKNFKIGRRVSMATYDIFETKHLSNLSFLDLMRPLITEKDLKTLESFLKLQFQKKTMSSQLEKYNPLKKIEITLNWDGSQFVNKHLGFSFERIMEGDDIAAVLITITDVTETLALENELKRANEDQERKTNILLEVVQSDSKELDIFLAQTEKALDSINDLLRDQGVSSDADLSDRVENLVESVFRMVHNIKGNASMLGLESITEITHAVEEKLAVLRKRKDVKGDEFLSALVQLASLRERLTDYQEITDTILKDFAIGKKASEEKKPATASERFATELSGFATKVARELKKEVFLKANLEMDVMTETGQQAIKDICVQLTRNSIVHGIEAPHVRKAQNKMSEGIIRVNCAKDETSDNRLGVPCYELKFRDDGAGLDLTAIKQRAVNMGMVTAEQAATLSNSAAVALIFEPKFSTQETADEHAGRGTGMSIVKEITTQQLGGKLSVSYSLGQYAQLSFLIPASSVEQSSELTVDL
ncbi:type IV pili methyl-accepting chemotaxis transducer N-terminal domain-containing protein [Rubritalea marina]|uniref:type IV pili methyl-accepting chemotaxis transducer N-terminal domain-containing protein n=1 Tax=Rubritalea marina TaxID=361055 RepID=UPI00036E500A|nr:type IV pili methyl-accepting chemotaxis transducer N-terminal domain-containing protein [Rubritalea marina]